MLNIALYQPEIPPNTGNIIRLCANTGAGLHLVGKLGFSMDDRQLRRAGLDYHEFSKVKSWSTWESFRCGVAGRMVGFSTHHETNYTNFSFQPGDILLFGSESAGLPVSVREEVDPVNRLTLPMKPGSRSLNLSNSVAIATYEAWRQLDFCVLDG